MTEALFSFLPVSLTLVGGVVILLLANRLLLKPRAGLGSEARLPRQLLMLALTLTLLVVLVLLLPVSETMRGQVLSLLGVLLTGVIALSSTTFVANAMAGLMLRMMNSFRPGDFVRIGEQFGRVTERGLLHTEIQTEDRDLTTLPNLHLVTNPVTVVHGSGTIISAHLSLGYDLPHQRIDALLREAAEKAGLQDPFVLVSELNDFSVTYRVAGFLPEVKQLLTAKSNLRRQVLDVLHANGVEIVSPSFMNQRQLTPESRVIAAVGPQAVVDEKPAEEIIFDKAEEAAAQEALRAEQQELLSRLKSIEDGRKGEKMDDTMAESKALKTRLGQIDEELAAFDESES